jgi:hypothetical protein
MFNTIIINTAFVCSAPSARSTCPGLTLPTKRKGTLSFLSSQWHLSFTFGKTVEGVLRKWLHLCVPLGKSSPWASNSSSVRWVSYAVPVSLGYGGAKEPLHTKCFARYLADMRPSGNAGCYLDLTLLVTVS